MLHKGDNARAAARGSQGRSGNFAAQAAAEGPEHQGDLVRRFGRVEAGGNGRVLSIACEVCPSQEQTLG